MADIFDFGFTAVNEEELEVVQKAQQQVTQESTAAKTLQERLDELYNAITPLLNNLKKNPEKDYILWPNRLEKVEQFETMLQKIYKGQRMWTGIVLWCALSNGVAVECEAIANVAEFYASEMACYTDINKLLRDPEVQAMASDPTNPIVLKEANCVEWKTKIGSGKSI